jgi:hypothetical protein
MKIANYLSSLLPTFGKGQVLEDCIITRTEITKVTQPAYDSAVSLLKGWKYKSPSIVADFATFSRMVKGSDNMIVTIQKSFKTILENLDSVQSLIEKTYSEEVAGAGLTYLKANLLQFVEATAFVSKYARKYLLYVYICETAAIEGAATATESITPAEVQWLKTNLLSFCTAFNAVRRTTTEVEKLLADIPDVLATGDNAGTMAATMGEARLDPFQMRLIPIAMNPIYHVGLFIAEWQANRYKSAQEELKLVQLRKLNLERVHQGRPDAGVQKEIAYMEARIQGINYKIDKMEQEYA